MTILHLIRSYGSKRLGGAEISISNLICLTEKAFNEKSIIISDFGVWQNKYKKEILQKEKKSNYKLIPCLIKNIKSYKIKNIHVHSNGYLIFIGFIVALLINSRLIIKVTRIGYKSLVNRDKENKLDFILLIKRYFFKKICKFDFVILHVLTKSAENIVKTFSNRTIVFPNLIKKGTFNTKDKIPNSFLISSRIIKRKNIDKAIDKFIALNKKNIRLYILGDGPELDKLKTKYKNYSSTISFLGYIDHQNIYKYYQTAEYYINLSDSEGMSNSLIEAMSYGCKCIISDLPENIDTAGCYAIYYDKQSDFNDKFIEASKLNADLISKYANDQYSVHSFNSTKIKELYYFESNNTSGRERK